jgi:hypothetical protein
MEGEGKGEVDEERREVPLTYRSNVRKGESFFLNRFSQSARESPPYNLELSFANKLAVVRVYTTCTLRIGL